MLLIICCSEISDPKWRWIAGHFSEDEIRFEFFDCSPRNLIEQKFSFLNLARLRGAFSATWRAKCSGADILVTHGPTLAAWCAIFARLLKLRSSLVAHSFNFAKLPGVIKTQTFSRAFRRVNRFAVFSRIEIEVYARIFGIPKSRFSFVHWGVRVPDLSSRSLHQPDSYISAIGGNARDYGTLIEAARLLPDIPFVLVVRPANLSGLTIPVNVVVHVNLALESAMKILFDSRFMVLPLNSSEVPCGHVTIVAAMHLGKTMIATASAGIEDYVRDGDNALTFPFASTMDLVNSIQRLWHDTASRHLLEASAASFAKTYCTEDNIARHFAQNLLTLPD